MFLFKSISNYFYPPKEEPSIEKQPFIVRELDCPFKQIILKYDYYIEDQQIDNLFSSDRGTLAITQLPNGQKLIATGDKILRVYKSDIVYYPHKYITDMIAVSNEEIIFISDHVFYTYNLLTSAAIKYERAEKIHLLLNNKFMTYFENSLKIWTCACACVCI